MIKKTVASIMIISIMCVHVYAADSSINNQPMAREEKILAKENSERDPFNYSTEMLQKQISDKYVMFAGKEVGKLKLPVIEITGVMAIGERRIATAHIKSLGHVTIQEGDRIIIPEKEGEKYTPFVIYNIRENELTLVFDGGYKVRGRFR